MPSVRFSRDKRGYEYVYLVHTPTRRGKPGRTRVLYWYRTPPGVRIGRKPFDEEVQRTLEQQNPGVSFDWEAIIATPMPPPDMTEFWRERRRAEKAARQERRAAEAEETARTTTDTSGAEPASDTRDAEPNADLSADAAAPRKRRRRRRRGASGEQATSLEAPSDAADSASESDGSDPADDDLADD